jgi:hypothetical protein
MCAPRRESSRRVEPARDHDQIPTNLCTFRDNGAAADDDEIAVDRRSTR